MKHILTNKNDEIFDITETLEKKSWGNYLVHIGEPNEHEIVPSAIKGIFEVEEVPAEVEIAKWCYTEEKGFYKNEDWKEPKDPIETRLELVEERVSLAEDMINMSLGF